jgi:arylsulfatase
LLAALLACAAACNHEPESAQGRPVGKGALLDRPNIVFVTIDTLRADHLGCYGYFRPTTPNIDALAKESVVFDQAYATMATTLPSHASMFTGRYPLEHGIAMNIQAGGNVFGWKPGMLSFAEVVKDAGYTTAGFVSAAALKKETGIDKGFDTWSDPVGPERRAGETIAEVLPWLDQSAKDPFFLWVHFYDPHWKHRAPPPYDTKFKSDDPDPQLEKWIDEREIGDKAVRSNGRKVTETRKALDDYCGEVAYADSQFGVLVDELRKRGLLDKSIFIFCADHGEGLNQHQWTAHGLVWNEQLRVPLMIRFPPRAGIAPQRSTRLVSLIDLFPTVLARMQPLETKRAKVFLALASGVDMLAPDFHEVPVFAQRTGREVADSVDPGEMYAVTTPEWKYIHEPEKTDLLFDRTKDPFELDNLAERDKATADRALELLLKMKAQQELRGAQLGTTPEGKPDPGLLKQLQELGYAGGNDGRAPPKDGDKDKPPAPPSDPPPAQKPADGIHKP